MRATSERPDSIRTIVRTNEDLARLVRRVRETGALRHRRRDGLGSIPSAPTWSASPSGSVRPRGYYIPLAPCGRKPDQLAPEAVHAALQPLLTDGALEAYAHHAKYDMAVLERHGYELTNLGFETMIAAYLLGETSMRLKDLAFTRLGREMTEIVALIGSGRNQLTMDMVDSDEAADYASADVEATFELADLLRPEIHQADMDACSTRSSSRWSRC